MTRGCPGGDRPAAGNGAERPTLCAGLLGTTYMAAIRAFRHLIVYPPLMKADRARLAGRRR